MVTAADTKPSKPYTEFPLFAHQNGQWCKKIKGKQWFFGVWSDPDTALRKYLDEVDEIQAGRDPRKTGVVRVSSGELSISDMCGLFLERQEARVVQNEITRRHFSDCLKSCRRLISHFGKFFRAGALGAVDFKAYRDSFPSTWGPSMVSGEIQRIRSAFKWAYESDLLTRMPNFGPDFRKPSKTVSRRDQQQREAQRGGKLDFSAEEIRTLLSECSSWLHACILLGINGGLGNADCGRLSSTFLDLNSGWYDLPRQKTGIPRRFKLWPETIEAIRSAMLQRPIAKNAEHDPLCFMTSHGLPVWWQAAKESGEVYLCDNISKAFAKLAEKCKVDRQQRGFYSLRRTFETVAGATKDQVAVDYIMGHADASMAAIYRQGIEDQRLIDVGKHVHAWLFPKAKKKISAKQSPAKKKPAK
jgi:integrase